MEKFEHRQLLRVFEKISRYGECKEGVHSLSGISTEASFDGYALCFWDADGSVTLQFHNTIACSFTNKSRMYGFMRKINRIDKDYD